VGKSTLLNHLLEQDLCIVSPKPQTTRHRIFGILTRLPANDSVSGGSSGGSSGGVSKAASVGSVSVASTTHPTTTTVTATATTTPTTVNSTRPSTLEQYQREGYQLVIADTPGMLTPAYKLQEVMQSAVRTVCVDGVVL